jgi:hypothetical protein
LIKKSFTTRAEVFAIAGVSQFRHLEKAPSTKHPLAGESFDSLGFQTQQELIKELSGDSRMAFDYEGRVIRFGENVYSWEFEEVAALVAAAGGDVVMPVADATGGGSLPTRPYDEGEEPAGDPLGNPPPGGGDDERV